MILAAATIGLAARRAPVTGVIVLNMDMVRWSKYAQRHPSIETDEVIWLSRIREFGNRPRNGIKLI